MARFGFVGPSYSSQSLNADAQKCLNWYPERIESDQGKSSWALYPTPGLSLFCALNGQSVRCIKHYNGRTFAVAGVKFYEITQNAVVSELGTVLNDGLPVSITAGQGAGGPGYILFASGGSVYVYNLATNTFTAIGAATLSNIGIVGYSDGYFIAAVRFSNQFFLSGLLDATAWNPADTSRISTFSGIITTMLVDHREILFGSPRQSVAYYNSGNPLFPFDVLPSGYIEVGSAAQFGAVQFDNSIGWWAQDELGTATAVRLQGYTPTRVSNHAVEYAVSGYSRIDDVVCYSYQDQGHSFWVSYFPSANNGAGATWVYDAATGMWHERGFLEANGTISAHRSQCHAFAWGKHLVGDWKTGNVYQMAIPVYNAGAWSFADDNGSAIRRVRRAPHISVEQEWLFHHQLQVDIETGLGPLPPLTEFANPAPVVLKDSSGGLWAVFVDATGLLQTVKQSGGSEFPLALNDPTGLTTWQLGVTTGGLLTTTALTLNPVYPIAATVSGSAGAPWTLSVTSGGLLQTTPGVAVARDPQVMLRWSDDGGHTWSNERSMGAGQAGNYKTRCVARRLGRSRDRVYEVACADGIPWRISDAYLQASPGFGPTERINSQLRKAA